MLQVKGKVRGEEQQKRLILTNYAHIPDFYTVALCSLTIPHATILFLGDKNNQPVKT